MRICELCKREHTGLFGSGRFCSQHCSRSFSTSASRKEINEKISKKLSMLSDIDRQKNRKRREQRYVPMNISLECNTCGHISPTRGGAYTHSLRCNIAQQFECLPRESRRRILLREANFACSNCGYNRTRNDGKSILEIDHIDGNPRNNHRDNLRVLCPNCHALTPNFRNHGNRGNKRRSQRLRKGNKAFGRIP